MRGAACSARTWADRSPVSRHSGRQRSHRQVSPAPPGAAMHPLGSSSHKVVGRVLAEAWRALLPVVHGALDVGTEVGELPRGC